MLALARFSIRHPRAVVAAVLALTLAAAWFVPGVELKLDGRSLIPADHPSMRASDAAAARFDLRDTVVLGLAMADGDGDGDGAVVGGGDGIYRPEALAALARLSAELERVPGIVPGSVVSLATVPRLYVEDGLLDLEPLLADAGGELPPGRATVDQVRREVAALGLDDGVLAAPGGAAAGIYAEVEPEADRYRLSERIGELAARHEGGGRRIWYSGSALVQAALGEAAALDLVRLVPLVLVIVGLVLTAAYRHPAPALVSLAEVGVSLAWTVGVMGVAGQGVFVTTLALPVILVVIGVSDDVYVLNRYFALARRDPDRPAGAIAEEALTGVYKPVLLTSVTTIVGLLSLAVAGVEPQRVFGLYGALAVAFSTLATFSLVPALLVGFGVRPRHRPADRRRGERLMAALPGWIARLGPRRILAGAGLLALASLALAGRLSIEDTWVRNLEPTSAIVRGDRAINARLAGTNTLELMFDGGAPEAILEPATFALLGRVERALAAHPDVGAVEGVFSEVARVDAALEGEDYAAHRRALDGGEARLDRGRIEQALLLLDSLARSPLTRRLDAERQRARMTVFVRSADYSKIGELVALASASAGPAFADGRIVPFGDGWIGHWTVGRLVVGQVSSIAIAMVADTLLLWLLFGSLGTALLAISPVVLSVLAVFGVLGASGAPLGTANSMFAAIALGIGVDYSIHLVTSYREVFVQGFSRMTSISRALAGAGPAILTSSLAIAAGFSVLAVSEVLPNRHLGLLVALSMAVCAVLTLVLLPALLLARGTPRPSPQPKVPESYRFGRAAR